MADRTGISGKFDIHIDPAGARVTPDAGSPDADSPGETLVLLVVQKLGMKLEPAKGPGEFLVIDRVERPTGN